MTSIGHNTLASNQLSSIVERIERLEAEKKIIADDIKDIYAEAKANGFDTMALRTIVRLRKQDADERAEQEAILETYMHALGMLSDTPIGDAALARDFQRLGVPGAPLEAIDTSNPPFNPNDE